MVKKIKSLSFEKLYDAYLGVFAFVILVFPKFTALSFLGFVPLIARGLIQKRMNFKVNLIAVLLISLYGLYAFYCLFTRHPDIANRYLEYKLALFILPLLLAFQLKNKIDYCRSTTLFILALLVLFVTSLIHSFRCFSETENVTCFITSSFSFQHHPTYTSVYNLFGIALLVYGFRMKFRGFNLPVVAFVSLLLIVSTLLCLSLAGVAFLFLMLGLGTFYFMRQRFGKLQAVWSIVFFFVLLFASVKFVPQIRGEIEESTRPVKDYVANPIAFSKQQPYPQSGSIVRLIMWTASFQLLAEYPLGVGTGNVDEVLMNKVNEFNQPELAAHNYNPHNQYLQTGIEVGIWGILVLLLIVLFSTQKGLKTGNWLLVLLAASFAFNMLFESMLQRQEGLVFYTLFFCVMYNHSTRQDFLSLSRFKPESNGEL